VYYCPLGFKYSIIRNNCSFGRYISDRDSSCYSTNRSSNTTFFIDPRIDKDRDRKYRIRNHHQDIINIFEHLGNITVDPVYQQDGLYKTCIPLYLDVGRLFKKVDKHDEAIIHLSDPEYVVAFNSIIQITNLENNNNRTVSQFISKKENEIRHAIYNNKNISIQEWISQSTEFPYYKLVKIFEHYAEESQQHEELKIVSSGR
jgi:hypothetical protein